MAELEKIIYGTLLFSMCTVIFSNYYLKMADIYSVSGAEDITETSDDMYNTINATFGTIDTEMNEDPTDSGTFNDIRDIFGVVWNSGINLIKIFGNTANLMYKGIAQIVTAFGISGEIVVYFGTFALVIVSLALIKVIANRQGGF